MKGILTKLHALATTKSTSLAAIQETLAQARAKIILLEERVHALEQESAWWKSLDESMARRENEERSDELPVTFTIGSMLDAPDFDLEDK